MAFTCGFFNSQNGDRKYNAEQMASIFDGLIKDGVYDTVGDIFAVTPGTGMQVLVGSGRAWFDHTWNNNDAQYPLAITAADVSLPRYDAVVLETNHSDTVRTNRLRVLTGTPSSNPVKPTMTSTANVKQHPLAYIKVTAGATAIKQSMIQVVVGTSECPFVTGIIDTAQIDALFQQWNGEFNEWFENLKAQLSDNVVANLQGQIDQKVAKADVATTADIEAGTSTTKWVSPKGLKEANVISKVGDIKRTFRTDLGNDWALCNGDLYMPGDYSELYDLQPSIFDGQLWKTLGSMGNSTGTYILSANSNMAAAIVTNGSSNIYMLAVDLYTGAVYYQGTLATSVYAAGEDALLLDDNTLVVVGLESYANYARVYEVTNILSGSPIINQKDSAQINGSSIRYTRIGYNPITKQCAAVGHNNGKMCMAFRDSSGNWTTITNIATLGSSYFNSRQYSSIESDGTNWIIVFGNAVYVVSPTGILISSFAFYATQAVYWPHILVDSNIRHIVARIDSNSWYDFTFTSWTSFPTSKLIHHNTGSGNIYLGGKVGKEYVIGGVSQGTPLLFTTNDFTNWISRSVPHTNVSASDATNLALIFDDDAKVINKSFIITIGSEASSYHLLVNGPRLPEKPSDYIGYNYIKVK